MSSWLEYIELLIYCYTEPDPTYTFTKPLAKKTSGYTKHEVYMECTVSSNLAQVSWYKGKTKLEVKLLRLQFHFSYIVQLKIQNT